MGSSVHLLVDYVGGLCCWGYILFQSPLLLFVLTRTLCFCACNTIQITLRQVHTITALKENFGSGCHDSLRFGEWWQIVMAKGARCWEHSFVALHVCVQSLFDFL